MNLNILSLSALAALTMVLSPAAMAVDPLDDCGYFAGALSTRDACSGGSGGIISFTGASVIHDNPDTALATCTVSTPQWVLDQVETCESADCTAIPGNTRSVSVTYDLAPAVASLDDSPSNSNTDVAISADTILTNYRYDVIDFGWAGVGKTVTFDQPIVGARTLVVNQITNAWKIIFADNENIEIGTISGATYTNPFLLETTAVPSTIKIKYRNMKDNSQIDLQASSSIQMETFNVGRSGSDVTIKAPTITINTLSVTNVGSGIATIRLIGDNINIGTLDMGQGATVIVEPYTAGGHVTYKGNTINASSSSTMRVSSGDYYTDALNLPGTSDSSSIIAMDSSSLVNLFINGDFNPGNNPGINSAGNSGNFGSLPATTMRIFVNGDFNTGGGGTTVNAVMYVEGDVSLGNPSYVRGAISAQHSITVGEGAHIYYDSHIDDELYAECAVEAVSQDICYDTITYDGLFCIDFGFFKGGIGCKQTIPLRNVSGEQLTAVEAVLNTSALSGNFLDSCGVNGVAGNCEQKSIINFGPIGIFNTGIEYQLPDFDDNETHSIYDKALISVAIFSGSNLYASYTKNGVKYVSEVNACSGGGGEPTTSGRFNVVYSDYANGALSSGYYYNLPTQVASRADNYKVISLHTASGFENTLRDVNTTVGVELIDYDSPGECANKQALSARAWTVFNNGSVADFSAAQIAGNYAQTAAASTKDEEFYQTAGKNVAFRISYNATTEDGDLVQTSVIPPDRPHAGNIAINNFTELAQGLKAYNSHLPPNQQNKCVVPVVRGNHTYTTMPESCGNASPSNGIDLEQLSICMECVYGANTVKMCSRDTFAIRPEAYVVKVSDQNQTNPASKSFLRHNVPSSGTLDLASGYNYYTEVNATSHTGSAPVAGYDSASSELRLVWNPGAGVLSGSCNDESNQTTQLSFTNGMATALAAHDQVGEYWLNVTDTNWTMVDWNASMMAEKRSASDAGFFLGGADCMVNSSVTSAVKTAGIGANAVLVGCNIDSNHTKPATSNPSMGAITYTNIETELRPYRFDMASLVFGAGIQPQAIGAGGEDFVYISDMSVDDNMSLRGVGSIQAKTYSGTTPSNFVTGCYAKNTKMGMNVVDHNLTLADTTFQVRFKTFENGGVLLYDSNAANMDTTGMSMPVIPNLGIAASIQDGNFTKTNAGAMPVDVRFNYDRDQTIRLNPMIAQFGDLNISCNNPSECSMYADLSSSHEAVGAKAMDFNVTYVYGRIIPRDVRIFGSVPFTANAWYEVWQSASLLGTGLAPSRNESGWFINTLHDDTNDGNGDVTVVKQTTSTPLPLSPVSNATGVESYSFLQETPPYSAKAHIDTNSWLWYGPNASPYADPVDATNLDCFTHPCFNINVVPAVGRGGSSTSDDLKSNKQNKETTPPTGVIYDYSPSVR